MLEAPNGAWANHVESLIRQALGGGSLTLGILGAGIYDVTEASARFVTGVATSDQPRERLVGSIAQALRDFEVEQRALDVGLTQLVVRPKGT